MSSSLTVFQRTAQWMFPNPSYHDEVGPGVQWALRHLPFYGRWYRFLLFWPWCDKGLDVARVDPDYPDQQKAINEISEVTRIMFTDWIVSQVGDDPDLQAKVVPDYPATGKRTLQDNGSWLRTLTRDNVELVRTGIDRIEPDAVVTEDGTRYPADVIVYATGFEHTKLLWPMTIRGRNGEVLSERWGERPSAYLGITIPDYPNFFCMNGPGTWLASGGSLIFHSECQMRYITQCLELLIAGGHTTMEPTVEKTTDWHERSQAEMRTMVWSQPTIKHSYFKNSFGEVHTLSPWRLVDYWTWTRTARSRRLRLLLRSDYRRRQVSRPAHVLGEHSRIVGDGAEFVAALDVLLNHQHEVHRVVGVFLVAPLAVARVLEDGDDRRPVDAAVAGIPHGVDVLEDDPALVGVDRVPLHRVGRHLTAGEHVHRRHDPLADVLAALHVAKRVLDVLRVFGEVVGVTGPVPRLADVDDGLLVPSPRLLELFA